MSGYADQFEPDAELKPCPFCGSAVKHEIWNSYTSDIRCDGCNANMSAHYEGDVKALPLQWNIRVTEDAQSTRIAALEKALREGAEIPLPSPFSGVIGPFFEAYTEWAERARAALEAKEGEG